MIRLQRKCSLILYLHYCLLCDYRGKNHLEIAILILHFETVSSSKKLPMTTGMWLIKDFMTQTAQKIFWKKGEIAHFEQFHLLPQCLPKAFIFSVLK